MNGPELHRLHEIDFLKGVMILLMVAFHLAWFADAHLYAKAVVYTFHMPVFLLISGYLWRTDRELNEQWRRWLWLFVPYAVMELGYVVMCFLLPVREHLSELSVRTVAYHLIVHPLGPYWYFHTLLICQMVSYVFLRSNLGRSLFVNLLLIAVFLASMDRLVVFANAMYFLIGLLLRQSGTPFLKVFRPSLVSLLPFVWLMTDEAHLNRATLGGMAITYFAVSLCLFVYQYSERRFPRSRFMLTMRLIGRNTLPILLFSPLFTLSVKPLAQLLAFDPTRLLFALCGMAIAVAGSLAIALAMDRLRLSPYFFGKAQVVDLTPISSLY
ncbi:MAG: acyltransferase [Bacteroidaceae bacterium]|nr:acyltransferase [Bacteroidaceae bacterium]